MMRQFLVLAVTFACVAGVLVFVFRNGVHGRLAFERPTTGDRPSLDSLVSRYYEEEVNVHRVEVKFLHPKRDFDVVALVAEDNEVILANEVVLQDRGNGSTLQTESQSLDGTSTKPFTTMVTLTEECTIRLGQFLAHLLPFFPKQQDKKLTMRCLILHTFNLPISSGRREWASHGDEFHQERAPEE